MTMLRLLPMGLFGAFIGAWAEKIERRITLILVVTLMLTTSTSLALLAYSGSPRDLASGGSQFPQWAGLGHGQSGAAGDDR